MNRNDKGFDVGIRVSHEEQRNESSQWFLGGVSNSKKKSGRLDPNGGGAIPNEETIPLLYSEVCGVKLKREAKY